MSRSDLQAAIERLEEAMPYRAGIYVQRLADGDAVAIRADDVFPQACIIKVPIVLALLQRVVDGDLSRGRRPPDPRLPSAYDDEPDGRGGRVT